MVSSTTMAGAMSGLGVSEARLMLSATVVGGVELSDATLEEESVGGPEKLDSEGRADRLTILSTSMMKQRDKQVKSRPSV